LVDVFYKHHQKKMPGGSLKPPGDIVWIFTWMIANQGMMREDE
jgi:hypothetical protein